MGCKLISDFDADAGAVVPVVGAFELRQVVKLVESEEHGTVIGVAFYTDGMPQYHVQYRAADGRQVTAWWREDQLAKF
jgi:hypothetical protein